MTHNLRRSRVIVALAATLVLHGVLGIAQAQDKPYWETPLVRTPSFAKSTVIGEWDLRDGVAPGHWCGWAILQGPQPSDPVLVQNCDISSGVGNGLGQPLKEVAPRVYRLEFRGLRLAPQADGRLEVWMADGQASYLDPTPAANRLKAGLLPFPMQE